MPTPAPQSSIVPPPSMDVQASGREDADPAPAPEGHEARIRERAYRKYLERGEAGGEALQDWLDAEAEEQRGDTAGAGKTGQTPG